MRVLYDGWSLIHQPDGAASLHLLTLLAALGYDVQPLLALPGEAPGWLPGNVVTISSQVGSAIRDRLAWEQRTLPHLARERQAALSHLTTATPALFASGACLLSPAGVPLEKMEAGFWSRLRESLAQGGMSRLAGLLWPEDLREAAPGDLAARSFYLPPSIYPGFFEQAGEAPALDLPETFILYHGSYEPGSLLRLLEAWSWAAGAIGEYYPLLLLGAGRAGGRIYESLAASYDFGASVRLLPPVEPSQVAAVYRACTVYFHPADVLPWENPLRAALVLGKAVVALDSMLAGLVCGPAAYLVGSGNAHGASARGETARALGAALITVVVEDGLREGLELAARERAAGWRLAERYQEFGERLLEIYRTAAGAAS